MKMFEEDRKMGGTEGGLHMIHERRDSGRHMLPHERKALLHLEFGEKDWGLLKEVFGDEDTARAAAEIIGEAPPEIQILAIQLMNIIEEVG